MFSKIGKSSQILNICLICKQTLKSSCVIPSQSVAPNLILKNGFWFYSYKSITGEKIFYAIRKLNWFWKSWIQQLSFPLKRKRLALYRLTILRMVFRKYVATYKNALLMHYLECTMDLMHINRNPRWSLKDVWQSKTKPILEHWILVDPPLRN